MTPTKTQAIHPAALMYAAEEKAGKLSRREFLRAAAAATIAGQLAPELLADVQGRTVQTMALAGSIRRGTDVAEDARLADQLEAMVEGLGGTG